MHCSSADASFLVNILLAEPLGSLAFKMVRVQQLENEQQKQSTVINEELIAVSTAESSSAFVEAFSQSRWPKYHCTSIDRHRRTRRSHDKHQCARWTHAGRARGRALAAKIASLSDALAPLLADRMAPRHARCRASSPARRRKIGALVGGWAMRFGVPLRVMADRLAQVDARHGRPLQAKWRD
ncbi:hypothetical protein F511_35587 [Dorcoceras hygrometricum]|uniref:Uncharacterized protein n=1 Tax=Dorcoceras hygrometricum TaxID=472368 RepID=A0A2Z7AAT9_9LAMI|nr:hypothetical protein F511_35587 [Dorcoceras hygrometricum]